LPPPSSPNVNNQYERSDTDFSIDVSTYSTALSYGLCERSSNACNYPQLANRKALAARREAFRFERAGQQQSKAYNGCGFSAGSQAVDAIPASGASDDVTQPSAITSHTDSSLPPRAVGLGLLDIYFERLYNAPLLFDRSELFESYLDDAFPPFFLRAVFDLSSIFLHPHSASTATTPAELTVLKQYAANGDAWANVAAQEVLAVADRPSLHTVRTLACLGLYCLKPFTIQESEKMSTRDAIAAERSRACFWASWASICISAIPEAYARNAWLEACNIPLPIPTQVLRGGRSLNRTCMDETWHCRPCSSSSPSAGESSSTMQSMLKLLGIWGKIQILVKQRPENLKITELEELSAAASRICRSHEYFPSFGRTPIKSDSQLLGLHSLYHLCRMVVISPLVSLFSGSRQGIPTIVDNGPANAAIVAQHALQHCRMIREYMSSSYDLTKVTPLIAFASFVATSLILTLIQSSKHRCHDEETESRRTLAQISLYARDTCHLLTTLQTYWYPLRSMLEELPILPVRSQDCTSMEELERIELSLTGVNSPAQDQDGMVLTYVDPFERPQTSEDGTHSHLVERTDIAPLPAALCADNGVANEDERAIVPPLAEDETNRPETLAETFCEIFDFQNMADWDLDCVALYVSQLA
ncbi:hypothetical protein FOXYS1_2879, partial [Fusarium oxysporum]